MKITVLRKMEYHNYKIYVMQFGWIFQYLFANNEGDIHQDHIIFKPGPYRRLLSFLKLSSLYTRQQLEEGEKIVLSGAIKTIDEIDKPGYKAKRRKAIKKQTKNVSGEKKQCLWQARETTDGPYYVCLTHGKIVKMKDGEKPHHD